MKFEPSKSLAGTEWDVESGGVEYHYRFDSESDFFVSGGTAGEGLTGNYSQSGNEVNFKIGGFSWNGTYDGEEFKVGGSGAPNYPGFYTEEIKRITLLGDDEELDWVMTNRGLVIKTPEKQGKFAHSFKIERYHHPKLD